MTQREVGRGASDASALWSYERINFAQVVTSVPGQTRLCHFRRLSTEFLSPEDNRTRFFPGEIASPEYR